MIRRGFNRPIQMGFNKPVQNGLNKPIQRALFTWNKRLTLSQRFSALKLLNRRVSYKPPISRKQFVAGSTSLLQTVQLNLKWLLMKQNRPFNADDFSAFVSWFVWSNIIWFVLGTTTFVSLIMYTIKTLKIDSESSLMNNLMMKILFKYDSKKISFKFSKLGEDNITPDFRKGVISLRNLKVQSSNVDVEIDQCDVTLNFSKWYQGKGLIKDVEIVGVSGTIINEERGSKSLLDAFESTIFQNQEYELGNIKLQDVDLDWMNPGVKEPFKVSIFNLELPKLRLKWCLFDLLKPKICSGSINDSMFTVHQKQRIDGEDDDVTRIQLHSIDVKDNAILFKDSFNWVVDGKCNIVCDIKIPSEDNFNLNEIIEEIKQKVEMISLTKIINKQRLFDYNNLFNDIDMDHIEPVSRLSKAKTIEEEFETPINQFKDMMKEELHSIDLLKESEKPANNLFKDTVTLRPSNVNKNKYLMFNLKIQFVNSKAKVPGEPPKSRNGKARISLEELRPIIALINNTPKSHNSFFSNHNESILNELNRHMEDLSLKQFTLASSTIYNLDKLYGKMSIRETNLVDLIVNDLYEDMVKNLNHELNSRLIANYGNYYNFNVNHLVNALSTNAAPDNKLFGIINTLNNFKLSFLVFLGLGVLF